MPANTQCPGPMFPIVKSGQRKYDFKLQGNKFMREMKNENILDYLHAV